MFGTKNSPHWAFRWRVVTQPASIPGLRPGSFTLSGAGWSAESSWVRVGESQGGPPTLGGGGLCFSATCPRPGEALPVRAALRSVSCPGQAAALQERVPGSPGGLLACLMPRAAWDLGGASGLRGDQGAELGGSRNSLVGAAGQPWAGVLGGGLRQGGRPPTGWGLRSREFTGRWAQPAMAEAERKTCLLLKM